MLALYAICLTLGAALFGLFSYESLYDAGLIPNLTARVGLTLAAAAGYCSVQFLYMTALRVLKPTRQGGPLLAEALSQLAALIFVPALLDYTIEWPREILYKLEPLLYLAVFGVLHVFFKLMSFFAALQSEPSRRLGALGWLTGAVVTAMIALLLGRGWAHTLEQVRPKVDETPVQLQVGAVTAEATAMPEGAVLKKSAAPVPGQTLSFRWAPLPEDAAVEPDESIYVSVTLQGAETFHEVEQELPLRPGEWSEMRIPSGEIPAGATACAVYWTQEKEPGWRALSGVAPLTGSGRKVLLSGPFIHDESTRSATRPNVVVLVVEGLSAGHTGAFGYARPCTPELDDLMSRSTVYVRAYTPAPEPAAAMVSLLTGAAPLRHGYLEPRQGPLNAEVQSVAAALWGQHYATAAFLDARHLPLPGEDGLFGFEALWSPDVPAEEGADQAGAEETLARLREWITANSDIRFFAVACLGELPRFEMRPVYPKNLVRNADKPTPLETFDSALAFVDARIGEFIQFIRNNATRDNTYVVITSTYGLDFSKPSDPARGLTEHALHVPLIVFKPGAPPGQPAEHVTLEDLAPTICEWVGVQFHGARDGRSLEQSGERGHPISVFGDPLVMTTRNADWRCYWQTGAAPFAGAPEAGAGAFQLYSVEALVQNLPLHNRADNERDAAQELRSALQRHLTRMPLPEH